MCRGKKLLNKRAGMPNVYEFRKCAGWIFFKKNSKRAWMFNRHLRVVAVARTLGTHNIMFRVTFPIIPHLCAVLWCFHSFDNRFYFTNGNTSINFLLFIYFFSHCHQGARSKTLSLYLGTVNKWWHGVSQLFLTPFPLVRKCHDFSAFCLLPYNIMSFFDIKFCS